MADDRPVPVPHPIASLRRYTDARIGIGRAGAGLPTAAHLDFAEAHARARDAVHSAFDAESIAARLRAVGRDVVPVESRAGDRPTYLRRPDLGRRLSDASRETLAAAGARFDLAIVLADGLSADAANSYAAPLALDILRLLPTGWTIAPIVVARQARVALSDPIGEALGATLVLMLIGERPGLSAADSLGAYMTFEPRLGRTDADRNCVSNIRSGGLAPAFAAPKLVDLLKRAAQARLSGVHLKDEALPSLLDPASMPSIEAS